MALAGGKCAFPFQSPPLTGWLKKDLEILRTFEFRSMRNVLCLDSFLNVVSQKKCRAPDRHAIAARTFIFQLEELFGNGCKTGFWHNKLEFKVVDGQDVTYKRMWRSFPDFYDRSVRFIVVANSSSPVHQFADVSQFATHHRKDVFLSSLRRLSLSFIRISCRERSACLVKNPFRGKVSTSSARTNSTSSASASTILARRSRPLF